jgi:DNA-binding transcriptional MerR regulator
MSTPENGLDLSAVGPAAEIPDKLYFRIGDVARLAGIKPYVLRFWETEFPGLGPKKSGTGHRLYRRQDVEMVLEIKRLLYEQRFTIEGARKFLETRAKTDAAAAAVKPSKRRSAKAVSSASGGTAAAAAASGMGPAKGQADLFGDGSAAALELVRKELREILGLLK